MYRTIANVVLMIYLFVHFVLIHIAIKVLIPADANPMWGIPFAFVYALFMGITMGICYYYILPKKSRKYWED